MRQILKNVPFEAYSKGIDSRSLGARLVPSLKYAFSTEVHTYAFSIAANVLLSFIPFAVLLLTVSQNVFHSQALVEGIKALLKDTLPSNQDWIADRVLELAGSHKAQGISLAILLFTSTGVLLPLEVALNRIWRTGRNRSFLGNQVVSYGLVLCCSMFAMLSVALTAVNLSVIRATAGRMGWSGIEHSLAWITIKVTALPATVLILFVIYYYLPNAKVPWRPVLLAAVLAGVVTEIAKHIFIALLPWLNFREVYGPFYVSVTLVFWAYIAGIMLLVGAYFGAYGAVRESEPRAAAAAAAAAPAAAPAQPPQT